MQLRSFRDTLVLCLALVVLLIPLTRLNAAQIKILSLQRDQALHLKLSFLNSLRKTAVHIFEGLHFEMLRSVFLLSLK